MSPERDKGRVYKAWRGDGIGNTTAEDIIKKYLQMVQGVNPLAIYFDWACKDMGTIASAMGLPFQRAEKSHDIGETTLNGLFQSGALQIYLACPGYDGPSDHLQTDKLVKEFQGLLSKTAKTSARDDMIDGTRYAVSKIPWDWEAIAKVKEVAAPRPVLTEQDYRRGKRDEDPDVNGDLIEAEFSEWEGYHGHD